MAIGMKKSCVFKLYQFILKCCLFLIFSPSSACASSDTEQQIKLSFIYNFAKFVTWSESESTAPLLLCVSSSQPLSVNLALLQGKKVNARPIQVRFLELDSKLTHCNMLFMNLIGTPQSEKMLSAINTLPILTISDKPDFVKEGGMIGMKELDNRLRFDINLSAAKKAGLTISSQLLQLADEILQ